MMGSWKHIGMVFAVIMVGAAGPAVASGSGMVVSDHYLASEIGAQVLRDGGNAVDAAVATAFALAVVLPSAGNLGGGGFLVHHGGPGDVTTFDFREKAPLAASERMFLDADGALPEDANHVGPLAVGVPGTVAGLWMAHKKRGILPWADLVQPAIELAAEGVPSTWRNQKWLKSLQEKDEPIYDASKEAFLKNGTDLYEPGEIFRQPDLAQTLERIRDHGRDGFYTGETAQLLAAFMAETGGLITEQDLARYEAVERPAIHGTYRGYDIYGMGPPSSGGIVLVEMLNILEGFDLNLHGHNTVPTLHLMTEAMRRAYADRAQYLGDADFNDDLPVAALTSKEHATLMRATIDPLMTSSSDSLLFGQAFIGHYESEQTTHFSVVDGAGHAVSLTYTLEESYGSSLTVPGAGFLLNNEMGDFNPIPGHTGARGKIGTKPNLIEPGKRMLSSMSPTIVAFNGEPVLVLGTPGGRTIINTVLQVVVNVVDHGMTLREAIDAPRIHHQWFPDAVYFEGTGFPPELRRDFADLGHQVRFRSPQGSVMGISIDQDTGNLDGVADSRSFDGGAASY